MKKVMTNTVLTLCVLLTALFIISCGDDPSGGDDPTLVGSWDLTQLIISSTILNDTLTPGVEDIEGTMTLNSDSTFTSNVDINHTMTVSTIPVTIDTTFSLSGNWSATADSITLTDTASGSQTSSYDISSNTLETSLNVAVSGVITIALIQSWKKQ